MAGTLVQSHLGQRAIESLQLGERVLTFTPAEAEHFPLVVEKRQERAAWRIRLVLERGESDVTEVELLRSAEWLQTQGARVGSTIWLDMPEMSVRGEARVVGIESCPIQSGQGRVVTGKFHHRSGDVFDLRVEGEKAPIGVTARHPFWSADRQDWVPVGELVVGERLQARDGSTPRVLGITKRELPEAVFNIEVDGDHCYRVGQQGLLVHNASQSSAPSCPDECKADPRFMNLRVGKGYGRNVRVNVAGQFELVDLNLPYVRRRGNPSGPRVLQFIQSVRFRADSGTNYTIPNGHSLQLVSPWLGIQHGKPIAQDLVTAIGKRSDMDKNWVAAHVLHSDWGGRYTLAGDWANIIPLTQSVNTGVWKNMFEQYIRNKIAVDKAISFCINLQFTYGRGPSHPPTTAVFDGYQLLPGMRGSQVWLPISRTSLPLQE